VINGTDEARLDDPRRVKSRDKETRERFQLCDLTLYTRVVSRVARERFATPRTASPRFASLLAAAAQASNERPKINPRGENPRTLF